MIILATYDGHETGVSEDNIDGGFVVNADWFKIAHPMALKHVLGTMAWLPEELGAAGGNHILRSTAVVNEVNSFRVESLLYHLRRPAGDDRYASSGVRAQSGCGQPTQQTTAAERSRWERLHRQAAGARRLPGRRSPRRPAVGHDPRSGSEPWRLGERRGNAIRNAPPPLRVSRRLGDIVGHADLAAGRWAQVHMTGNAVTIVGIADEQGGLADVYLDGVRQRVPIDCWNPTLRRLQTLYYHNGLPDGTHDLRIVVLGKKNPRSQGNKIRLSGAFWSSRKGPAGSGAGGGPGETRPETTCGAGVPPAWAAETAAPQNREVDLGRVPTGTQRMVFGYTGRQDLKDSAGNLSPRHGIHRARVREPTAWPPPGGPSRWRPRLPARRILSCIATGSTQRILR